MPNDPVAADILQMLQPPTEDDVKVTDNPQSPSAEQATSGFENICLQLESHTSGWSCFRRLNFAVRQCSMDAHDRHNCPLTDTGMTELPKSAQLTSL